ncbi:hypothetical protein DA801_04445 [Lacticaseibacillus rhamnosus]|uniref:hypothetical protein n=2 Tax=Lacticaseibacillus rhamnosus TaxID=47715 RepID=UPI00062A3CEC|nr:hypothetical protein [Lacticaseibacillus rhamnosus]KKW87749.1 hypothetical protein XA20_07545 [Lacticaseibacillus rhamnosus]PTM25438.1 hypothetical protein DA801_04445 [Lacticaseibacillus rhamnosus]
MNKGLLKKSNYSQDEMLGERVREVLYFSGFAFIFFGYFLQSTILPEVFNIVSAAATPIKFFGAFVVFLSLFLKKNYKISFLALGALFLLVSVLVRHYSTVNLVYVMILIIGANGINFNGIARLYVLLEIICISITILLCLQGIIPNLTYFRYSSMRQAFGFIYPTDFAAHLTFLYVTSSYLRGSKFKLIDALFGIGIAIFQFRTCEARLDSSLVLLSVVLFYLLAKHHNLNTGLNTWINKVFANALYFLIPFLFALTFLLPKLYMTGSSLAAWLDGLLSGRIYLVAEGMQRYPFTLFGQQVITNGYGGLAGQNAIRSIYGYFMLDSSFAITGITYGIIMSAIVLFIFWNSIRKAKQARDIFLLISILIISIHCFVAQFYFDPSYNIFLLLCFSRISFETVLRQNFDNNRSVYTEAQAV